MGRVFLFYRRMQIPIRWPLAVDNHHRLKCLGLKKVRFWEIILINRGEAINVW